MSEVVIEAKVRSQLGKASRRLRRDGFVPGIFYAHGEKNIPISIPELKAKSLAGSSTTNVINLSLDNGSKYLCILRDVQIDPLTERPVHCDFMGLKSDEEIIISVPVVLKGTPKGVKEGGTLQAILHRLHVSCLPKDIPQSVEIDVTELSINRSIHVKELTIPNARITDDEHSTVVAVLPPTVIKEEAPAAEATAEAAPAEPEVIGKGKKAEEGAEEEEKE